MSDDPRKMLSDPLRDALKPFADLADWIDAHRRNYADPAMEVQIEGWPYTLSVEWLYNARQALSLPTDDGQDSGEQVAVPSGMVLVSADRLRAFVEASEAYYDTATGCFSDTAYDADSVLAEADAVMFVDALPDARSMLAASPRAPLVSETETVREAGE